MALFASCAGVPTKLPAGVDEYDSSDHSDQEQTAGEVYGGIAKHVATSKVQGTLDQEVNSNQQNNPEQRTLKRQGPIGGGNLVFAENEPDRDGGSNGVHGSCFFQRCVTLPLAEHSCRASSAVARSPTSAMLVRKDLDLWR